MGRVPKRETRTSMRHIPASAHISYNYFGLTVSTMKSLDHRDLDTTQLITGSHSTQEAHLDISLALR